jgi:hypothetical protein
MPRIRSRDPRRLHWFRASVVPVASESLGFGPVAQLGRFLYLIASIVHAAYPDWAATLALVASLQFTVFGIVATPVA